MRFFYALLCVSTTWFYAQNDSIPPPQSLKEVVVSSTRIELPFSENARTLQIISAQDLKGTGALALAEALQQVVGVDIRRRGVLGTQADLYIRGGSFDQTLILIDGIKLDDSQTGHHSLNFLPPLEVIERVEIIKGPAARIFGQNAFTGAINIVTKKEVISGGTVTLGGGSFGQLETGINLSKKTKGGSIFSHFSRTSSDGYRYNTDFKNNTAFIQANTAEQQEVPLQVLAFFSGRKFGANGFYASPDASDQYEETESSLLAIQSKIKKGSWILKPNLHWRRGQDHYLFIRSQPEIYENWHITNKVGAVLNSSYVSNLGTTGLGFDVSRVSIASNNLGNRSRGLLTFFLEQRFDLGDKVKLTPGVAVNFYSDFGAFAYPGIDVGVQLSPNWQAYANLGYTYRIPTYTDLYYSDRTTTGNENLKPEEALATELGIRFNNPSFRFYAVYFDRRAENLIDYVKTVEESKWEATNIQVLNTRGIEVEAQFPFLWKKQKQNIRLGYTYLTDDLKAVNVNFSRYSINSLKHQLTASYDANITSKFKVFAGLKYGQRPKLDGYTLVDANLIWNLNHFQFQAGLFNLFEEVYSETNLVPMPGRNGRASVRYTF